jgi:uncharacterized protein
MTQTSTIDLGHVARDLHLPPQQVQRTLELLDEGNTVPFITRYRKDQTGGLDEEQIRGIQARVGKIRQLAERKATILKTIEAQGKLTPELAAQIEHANTPKRLEDLYLPFKPKKQTLSTAAREKGLEPLAIEILDANPAANDLAARAREFVSAEKGLNTVDEVLTGVGHIIAERFSENAELRGRLRKIFQRSGKVVCTKVEAPAAAPEGTGDREQGAGEAAAPPTVTQADAVTVPFVPLADLMKQAEEEEAKLHHAPVSEDAPAQDADSPPPADSEQESAPLPLSSSPPLEPPTDSPEANPSTATEVLPTGRLFEPPPAPAAPPIPVAELLKKKKKKKKKVIGEHAFKDYYNYSEPLGKVPPHRVLAINRGERAHAIRVKIESDGDALYGEACQFLIPAQHPHRELLAKCVDDALARLIVPSLERELRREMTERAEEHAVEVFIRNLRKLLLQPPTKSRRVLAIDPGFKSGSKMAALDEFGNVTGTGMIFVIGKDEERRKKTRARLADMVKQHDISVIAIGNGTGCRETEQLVADCLADELKDRDVAYVVVNEAGASIYSTSPLGREELPQHDALQRGAISIGRRLLDPLSEMVKIHPANLGVGLYQHDIKAKHLKDSLDAVVESCVNFVGVDVNSASPALLRYVSGMNALTARRVYEYRREKGPFKNREELKNVPSFGEQTYLQAAGFLKVIGGENPLDATWIHPESYEIAGRVLEKLGLDLTELAKVVPAPVKKEEPKEFAAGVAVESGHAVEDEKERQRDGETERQGDGETTTAPVGADAADGTSVTVPFAEVAAAMAGAEAETTEADQSAEVPASETISDEAPTKAAVAEPVSPSRDRAVSPSASQPAPSPEPAPPPPRNIIADRANETDVPKLAEELGIGYHLLDDILMSLCRPALDPRDNLAPPVFRRGIIKLEDLTPGMELSGTVLNVVDFGVFVDIGLSDSGLVHISRLADRFIRDPHEVVGVGDVLKVWVVDIDKDRRRVSLTAIAPGSERPPQPPRQRRERKPRRGRQEGDQQRSPQPAAVPAGGPPPPHVERPPRQQGEGGRGGGRRDRGRGRRPQSDHPQVIERPPTKPKPNKPITKAQEEGRSPLRSFSDLAQLFDKKKQKPEEDEPPPPTTSP